MKEIKIAQAPVFTSPNPMTFICSKKADGKTNMATLAFWTYASTNPGKVRSLFGRMLPPTLGKSCFH